MKANIVLLILLLFAGCKSKIKTDSENAKSKDLINYSFERNKSLIRNDSIYLYGSEIINVADIIGHDSILKYKSSSFMLFYFSAYDCASCIVEGFRLVKIAKHKNIPVIVILTDGSIGTVRKKYIYPGYIFYDRNFILNEQLNYTSTPLMLGIDSTMKIINSYHPKMDFDTIGIFFNEFLKCLK